MQCAQLNGRARRRLQPHTRGFTYARSVVKTSLLVVPVGVNKVHTPKKGLVAGGGEAGERGV